jgi:hypothetical protein
VDGTPGAKKALAEFSSELASLDAEGLTLGGVVSEAERCSALARREVAGAADRARAEATEELAVVVRGRGQEIGRASAARMRAPQVCPRRRGLGLAFGQIV